MLRRCLAALSIAAGLLVAAPVASAHHRPAPVFGPHAHPYGLSYGQWGAAWWTWALTQPKDVNPLLDPTGANCAQGQRGPVWFLAGTFGGVPPSVTRTCSVPRGKALLFPVLNQFSGATETDPADQKTEAFQRPLASKSMRAATNLHATIDGVGIRDIKPRYFEESPVFKVILPANDVFGLGRGCLGTNTDAGCIVFPTVDAGYYLVVKPLRPGRHTLNFGGDSIGNDGKPFSIDATYTITIAGHGHHR